MVASAYLVERHMFSQQHKRLLMTAIHYYVPASVSAEICEEEADELYLYHQVLF
jgi:hypothetical protein